MELFCTHSPNEDENLRPGGSTKGASATADGEASKITPAYPNRTRRAILSPRPSLKLHSPKSNGAFLHPFPNEDENLRPGGSTKGAPATADGEASK